MSSDDPVMNVKEIADEIFPGTAESTVSGWARRGMFGKVAGKVGRGYVWRRSAVVDGAKRAGKLDAEGKPVKGVRGAGTYRKLPEGPQFDEDGMRLRTREQVAAVFGVPRGWVHRQTVMYSWMSRGNRQFPKVPDVRRGANPMWRDDTLTKWADAHGIRYDLSAEPEPEDG